MREEKVKKKMARKVLIGTSGWSYDDDWVGPFYPKGLKSKDFFAYYSQIFYTTEINTTFYNIPSRWIVESWAEKSPQDFLFSAKVPKSITHKNKLAEIARRSYFKHDAKELKVK